MPPRFARRRLARTGSAPPLLVAALLAQGCGATLVTGPADDATLATAAVQPAPSPSPPARPDLWRLQRTLDAVAAAFAAGDPAALRRYLDDPSSLFGRRWLARAENLRGVPLSTYRLQLAPAFPVLTTAAARDRFGADAEVVYVVEEHALEGFDEEGPAVSDLFLTVVQRAPGTWRIADDTGAEPLGLYSADHLWDHGPVAFRRDGPLAVLHHPETAGSVGAVLAEARAALDDVRASWPLPWSGRVPILVPRDEDELAELLHVDFDLSDFVAFATATPSGELGDYRLTGTRVVVNTRRFLERSPAARRRVLAHELLHAATRPHSGPHVPSWVEEGLAQRLGERASTTGTALLGSVARRGFRGDLPADADFTTGGRDRIFLSYQLAWSFADYLADAHGEAALARFYAALGQGAVGEPGLRRYHLDRAAREAFGADLDELRRRWAGALVGS